jgi:hypothetical protein
MNLDVQDRRDIIAEIHEYHGAPRLKPGEFTVRQYAELSEEPMTDSQAAGKLRKLVEAGILKKREVLHEGKWKGAFSKV